MESLGTNILWQIDLHRSADEFFSMARCLLMDLLQSNAPGGRAKTAARLSNVE
jgi:hypothetical protein